MTTLRSALFVTLAVLSPAGAAEPLKDNFGDALPEGAKARIGTTRMHKPGGGAEWEGAALMPDGKFLLSPVERGAIARIDIATGRAVGTIGDKLPRRSGRDFIRLSADGKRGVSYGGDMTIAWDAQTGRELTRVERQLPTGTSAVALSADGTTLAVGATSDETGVVKPLGVLIWDVGQPKRRIEIVVEEDRYVLVALSPDGKLLATWGQKDGQPTEIMRVPDVPIQFWNATTGKALGGFTVKESGLSAITFTPDGKSVAIRDGRGAITFVDPKTGRESKRLTGKDPPGGLLGFSPDGKTLAAGGAGGTIQLWDVTGEKPISTTKCPERVGVNGIVFTGEKQLVAWGIEGSKAVVWEVPSGKVLSPTGGHGNAPGSLAFTPDGKELLTNGEQWTEWSVQRWNATTGKPLGTRKLEVPAGINLPDYKSVKLLPGGTKVEAYAGVVRYVHDARTGKRLHDLSNGGRDYSAQLSADGELALTPLGVNAGERPPPNKPLKFAVKELATDKKLVEIELPAPIVMQATRTRDGTKLATLVYVHREAAGLTNYVATLWDLATGKKLAEVTEVTNGSSVIFAPAPDGKTALMTNAKGLRVIEFATGKVLRQIDTNGLSICAGPVFSPDGKTFALGLCHYERIISGGTFEVRVYESDSGKVLKTFRGHLGLVSALAFSPDGKTLASGSMDTTVLLWDLSK